MSSTFITRFIARVADALMSDAHFSFNHLRQHIPVLARRQPDPAEWGV